MEIQNLSFLIKSCIKNKSLSLGKLLHSKSIVSGLQNNQNISKTIINFYISVNLLSTAQKVLESIKRPTDASLFNSLISAYSKNQLHQHAMLLFNKLTKNPFAKPDFYTYPSVLKSIGQTKNLGHGKMIHCRLVKWGYMSNIVVSSSLVSVYAKCKLFELAIKLFGEMTEKDVASWNTVISCYYQDGQPLKSLEIFDKMIDNGFKPDQVTFTIALSACARASNLTKGKMIHEELTRSNFQMDEYVGSALVDMYGKCGCVKSAREVFDKIRSKSIVTWNTMLGGYSLVGDVSTCMELLYRMSKEGFTPTSTTISNILLACCRTLDDRTGRFIHGYVLRNIVDVDIFVTCLIIDFYFKCNNEKYAESLCKKVSKDNEIIWNVMISGHVANGSYLKAISTYQKMRNHRLKPDNYTYASVLSACAKLSALNQGKEIHEHIKASNMESNEIVMCALLDMYAKCGAVKEARMIFDKLKVKDTVSWTSMITAYGSHGHASEALTVFDDMIKSDVKPDSVVLLEVMSACSHAGLVDESQYYFDKMVKEYGIRAGVEHVSCYVDLLGRAGRLREAMDVVKRVKGEVEVDVGLLTSLLSVCGAQGNIEVGEEVVKMVEEMGVEDHAMYVAMSNMYSSVGKWSEVRRARKAMKEKGLKKNPGCSWIEIEKNVSMFYVEDDSHPEIEFVHLCLGRLFGNMNCGYRLFGSGDVDFDEVVWQE